jgi:predicted amidohydrolase
MAATNQSWIFACNAVGEHAISGAKFWGGSGIWAPSGLEFVRGSHQDEELIIVHNMDIIGERKFEKDDFDYAADLKKIYQTIEDKRAFTRTG